MPVLPALSSAEFASRLRAAREAALDSQALERLFAHYEELRRWAPRLDLIGPGAVGEIFERHYAEALAALPWMPAGAARLVDLGSGAGFPGLVLAAARPDLEVWLVEPRARRAAFLAAAARRMRLSVRLLAVRVAEPLPPEFPSVVEVLTVRGLRLEPRAWRALASRLVPGACLISWSGGEPPELPNGFVTGRELRLPGADRRRLREYRLEPVSVPGAA